MLLRNCWYVAAWSSEVRADAPFARTVANVPLVMWRSGSKLAVLEDRCCHRGMPLSSGMIEHEHLRCIYHGLRFDATGRCIEIPGQARIPPSAKVRTFPVVERHKWIWVWLGEPAAADESTIPDTHWVDDPAWSCKPDGYLHYDVNYLLIADNLLDFSHLPFVHPDTVGGSRDYASHPPIVERRPDGVRITRWTPRTAAPGFVQRVRPYRGPIDRWNVYDFSAPGILRMDSGMCESGSGGHEGERAGATQFRSCQALTPETECSTHYFFAQPHNLGPEPEVTEAIHAGMVDAFLEDHAVITEQARMLERSPAMRMVPLGVDAALLHFRQVIEEKLRQEAAHA
ncbi:aromatic ring-hydroxylating dioxygenase subunit alpha [Burkholderia multivorans]|uniref:aromatic ring-hydroxylating dioxygenase subunit alpha n=1 Tax=Burkholderia multivorans TaxID=87883 RepID=UPI001C221A3A|nr:aromatic ring-hydroxylating dioxygenase subunit alpha [Burkholderia multivorans]MBU9553341.1 aromatic ring-hydroxylating dioxygenase subunit alpha [Burkholderia multivorans]